MTTPRAHRDVLWRRPWFALGILVAGDGLYVALCYPHWDRIYHSAIIDAVAWLWPAPVLLSALYDRGGRLRFASLAVYALVSAASFAAMTTTAQPPRTVLSEIMTPAVYYIGPAYLVGIYLIEWTAQKFFGCFRELRDAADVCAKCGYSLMHLTKPRCPECGTPFDPQRLEPGHAPHELTPIPWLTRAVAMIMILAAAGAPFAWRAYELNGGIARRARAAARDAWHNGEPRYYFDKFDRRYDLIYSGALDPSTGLKWELYVPLDSRPSAAVVEERTRWGRAYNEEIDELLSAHGPLPICRHLLKYSQIKALLDSDRLQPLPPNGVTHGPLTFKLENNWFYTMYRQNPISALSAANARYVVLPKKDDLLVLVVDGRISTWLPDGTFMQIVFADSLDNRIAAFEE